MAMKRAKPGQTLGLGPPEGQAWSWMTNTMLGSITFRALGIHARRILDFLLHEHTSHRGRENGNLAAPYEHLETWGVTSADVRKGFAELRVCGFVELTKQGSRVAGGGEPSRYALTWLPTLAGTPSRQPPTHAWRAVLESLAKQKIGNVIEARQWLRNEVAAFSRGRKEKRKLTPHLQVVSPIKCEATTIQ
jgi:hypothetical protein